MGIASKSPAMAAMEENQANALSASAKPFPRSEKRSMRQTKARISRAGTKSSGRPAVIVKAVRRLETTHQAERAAVVSARLSRQYDHTARGSQAMLATSE